MESALKTWESGRRFTLNYIESLPLEHWNTIPKGFKNNIVWNFGHILVVQQLLYYKGASLDMHIPTEWVGLYKPGSVPTEFVTLAHIEELKSAYVQLISQTKSDVEKGLFSQYQERTTSAGFHLAHIQDAMVFNNYHEGIHTGIIMSLIKAVNP